MDLNVSATAPRILIPVAPAHAWPTLYGPASASTTERPGASRSGSISASLGTGTKTHTLVISIDTPNATTFSAVIPAAGKIIDSVRLPATVSAG